MPNDNSWKQLPLWLLDFLKRNTNAEHPITIPDLKTRLTTLSTTGNPPDNRTIESAIDMLQQFTDNAIGYTENTRPKRIWYDKDNAALDISLNEWQFILDAIGVTHSVSDSNLSQLREKIMKLVGIVNAEKLKKRTEIPNIARTQNKETLNNLEVVTEAIQENKQIRFRYYHYSPDKMKIYERNGNDLFISPYYMKYSNGYYYVLGVAIREKHTSIYRLDRMEYVEKRNKDRDDKGLSVAAPPIVPNRHIFGENEFNHYYEYVEKVVSLLCPMDLCDKLIDEFGSSIVLIPVLDGTKLLTSITVDANEHFYNWLCQLGNDAEVLMPFSVANGLYNYRLRHGYETEKSVYSRRCELDKTIALVKMDLAKKNISFNWKQPQHAKKLSKYSRWDFFDERME